MPSDWTISQTLDFIAGSLDQKVEDIWRNARSGKIKITGRRYVEPWRAGKCPGARGVSALAWEDLSLCRLAGKWAAADERQRNEFLDYQYNKTNRLVVNFEWRPQQSPRLPYAPAKDRIERLVLFADQWR